MSDRAGHRADRATRLSTLLPRRWLLAAAAVVAGFTVVATAAFFTVTGALRDLVSSGPPREQAIGCVTPRCGVPSFSPAPIASSVSAHPVTRRLTPRAATPAPPHPRSRPPARRAAAAPGRPAVKPTPVASPPVTARPAPVSSPAISAAITTARWPGGYQAQLTIANHSSAMLSQWQLAIALGGDQVTSVWFAQAHVNGDVLVLRPTSWDAAIPPGGTLDLGFTALGPASGPGNCTVNGASCR
jgi:cellulase/cellobiase CelA1